MAEATVKPKVTVDRVYMVGISSYKTNEETCGICKNKLTEPSANQMAKKLTDEFEVSFPAKGKCGHVFHHSCITELTAEATKTRRDIVPTCPTCQTNWRWDIQNMESDLLEKQQQRSSRK